jgi:hypothetical protein
MVCKLVDLANRIKSGFAQTSSPVRVLTDTAAVDRDLDCVVAGHGCPPHGRIALA